MFLSKLSLNTRDRQVRFDLARPYEMHRSLWRAFPAGETGRVLFRLETDRHGGPPVVLVQSAVEPAWAALPGGYLARTAEAKPFCPGFALGQRVRFRLRANPTRRVAAANPRLGAVMAGKRVGVTSEADQVRWLVRKLEPGGFRLPGGWVDAADPDTGVPIRLPNFRVDVAPEGRDRNDKPGHGGVFLAVRFDGVAVVTDPALAVRTIAAGIGSGKSFGFGLLSVAPA